MNCLKKEKKLQVVKCLVEGCSIRSTERMTGVHRDTIVRLVLRIGNGCQKLLDKRLVNLECIFIQADEIWTFVKKKQYKLTNPERKRSDIGEVFIYVAMDPMTKLVINFFAGKRNLKNTYLFIKDLKRRVINVPQISTDGYISYESVIETVFHRRVHYGQIIKNMNHPLRDEGKWESPRVISVDKASLIGNPVISSICTSHIERQNLTMRMQIRRLTRKTNGYSKKLENLQAALALHFAYYNFARIHSTLNVTPAMEADVENRIWSIQELVDLEDWDEIPEAA